MPLPSAMTSWWPCQYGSSTSTCGGWPKKTWCGWSRGDGPWRTEATPPAAASNVWPRRRSWKDKRLSCSTRWTSWHGRTPAWDWSWMPYEPSTRLFSVSPGLSPVDPSRRAKWRPPVWSPSSSPIPAPPRFQPRPSVDRTGLRCSCLVLTLPDPVHPILRRRSVVRLRDGMGEASSMWCNLDFITASGFFLSDSHNLHCLCTVQIHAPHSQHRRAFVTHWPDWEQTFAFT